MSNKVKITYYGHSCFIIESEAYSIALDPYDEAVPGYKPLRIKANEVLCSHGHGDHAYTEAVEIIHSKAVNPFTVTKISSFHDPEGGKLRGTNIIRIFEIGGIRIAHFGDIGCKLTEDQMELLKSLDAALIPVGGTFTLDAAEEKALMDKLCPKIIIPMHYRNGEFGYPVLGTCEQFTQLYEKSAVTYLDSDTIEITPDSKGGVFVL